jgi:hypothetical protein
VQVRAEQAGAAVPPVEATGVVCAIVVLAGFAVLAWRLAALSRPAQQT